MNTIMITFHPSLRSHKVISWNIHCLTLLGRCRGIRNSSLGWGRAPKLKSHSSASAIEISLTEKLKLVPQWNNPFQCPQRLWCDVCDSNQVVMQWNWNIWDTFIQRCKRQIAISNLSLVFRDKKCKTLFTYACIFCCLHFVSLQSILLAKKWISFK
jgi:hypothetical protein